MKEKKIGNWLIEYDYEATKNAYKNIMQEITCDCQSCRNYIKALFVFPEEVHSLFNELGIDLLKPVEVYETYFERGTVQMGGWYHIVGKYVDGEDAWQPVNQKMTDMFTLSDGFQVGFTHMVELVSNGFPNPILQMEINFNVPWELEEAYKQKPPTKKELRKIDKKVNKRQLIEKLKSITK